MRVLIGAIIGLGMVTSTAQARDTYVKPYIRNNGTVVQGHWRSSPNSTPLDNYNTRPNFNPYSGRTGTENPYPVYRPYQPARPSYPTYQPPRSYGGTYGSYGSSHGDSDDGE